MYEKTTKDVYIRVEPVYLEDQSNPTDDIYVWAYHVLIENRGSDTVTLYSRHWKIMSDDGNTQEVQGEGVVGEQPTLKPGESFEYTSGTPLNAPSGMMFGSYSMINDTGDDFQVEIPAFSLDSPYKRAVMH